MNNSVVAVLVIVIIALVGWVAYSQGYFDRAQEEETGTGLNIELGGSSDTR
jgi:hypothetical protein